MTAATGLGTRQQRDQQTSSQLFDSSLMKPPPHEAIYSYDSSGEENNFHDCVEVQPSLSLHCDSIIPLEIHGDHSGEADGSEFSRC